MSLVITPTNYSYDLGDLFKAEIYIQPTPETYTRCMSCGTKSDKLNEDTHCVICAEKNRQFNIKFERKEFVNEVCLSKQKEMLAKPDNSITNTKHHVGR